MGIRLTQLSTGLKVEAELGKNGIHFQLFMISVDLTLVFCKNQLKSRVCRSPSVPCTSRGIVQGENGLGQAVILAISHLGTD